MTANWFEAKVKYMRVSETGHVRKVTEAYLVDAMSYTEAEARIMEEMGSIIKGDYHVPSLKVSKITELIASDDENDDRWYKAKVMVVGSDENSGKDVMTPCHYLVAAADTNRALENLNKVLETLIDPCEVVSISETNIVDVFPCAGDRREEIPGTIEPTDAL